MATFYTGGSGTDPLIRIEVYETSVAGTFNVKVTQVQATDADAFLDPDGKFYLGDLRAFYLDFANPESFSISNFKGYAGYDATGTPVATSPTATAYGSESISSLGSTDTNMNGADGGKFDAGIAIGTQGIKKDDIGSVTFTVVGDSNLTLADFLNAAFGVRVTSVGLDANMDGDVSDRGESRELSSKINTETPGAPDPAVVTIHSATAVEGAKLDFSVTLSNASALPIVLNFAAAGGTATAGEFETSNFEYSIDGGANWLPATGPGGTQVTIPAGTTSIIVRLDTTNDVYLEGAETMTLSASVVSGSVASIVSGTGTITDSIDTTVITLGDVTAVEGANATITAQVSNAVHGSPLVITLSNGATITIPVGSTIGTSTPFLSASDDVYLDAGNYVVSISSTTGGGFEAVNIGDTATVAVTDDADQVTVTLSGSSVSEGPSAAYTFTATLSSASQGVTTITTDQGVITIANGATQGTLVVGGNGEDVYLDASSLTATITGTAGGNFENLVVATASATANVTNTIDTATILIGDVTVSTGSSATINASVSHAVTGADLLLTLSNGATVTIPVGATAGTSTSFTPSGNGTISITSATGGNYEALDTSDTAAVTISNSAPDAVNDNAVTAYGVPIQINVLGNDTDPNGDALSITANSTPAHGSVVLNANNTFTYTPASGYSGADSFTYTISDGNGGFDTATVNLTVGAPTAPPTTNVGMLIVSKDTAVTFDVAKLLTQDGVAGNDNLRIVSASGFDANANRTPILVTLNSNGTLSFTATTLANGQDKGYIAFTLSDGSVLVAALTVINGDPGVNLNDVQYDGYWASYIDSAAGPDTLTGGTITGGESGSYDVFLGGSNDDTLIGSDGNDVLRGGAGNDTLTGGNGVDLIDLSDASSSLTFTLGAGGSGSFNGTSAGRGTDTYTGMEGVIGSAFADTLTGNNADNEIRGGSGNDTVNGLDGNDVLYGDDGNDAVNGGIGDDTLIGGNGTDTLTGGTGTDTFVIIGTGIDTITDYAAGEIIDVSALLTWNGSTTGFIRLTAAGDLQIDTNGGGDSFVTIVHITTPGGNATIKYAVSPGTTATALVVNGAAPVAIDLNGDGTISFIGTNDGAMFDYGLGAVATAWVGPSDGILVRDENHDGDISANELVFATTGSDLQGLVVYDTNHDGQLSSDDASFADFAVWQDFNSDGHVDAGELGSLTAHSIASISLSSDGVAYEAASGDVQVLGTGTFTRANGTTGLIADAVFSTVHRSMDEQLRTAATAGAGFTVGAIAAAGLAAITSTQDAEQAGSEIAPGASTGVSTYAAMASTLDSEHPLISGVGTDADFVVADAAAIALLNASTAQESNHSLIGSEVAEAASMTTLLDGTEVGASTFHSNQFSIVAQGGIAIPSAAMLAEAFQDSNGSGSTHTQELSHVLVDVLSGGSGDGPSIDAMLLASLPAQGIEQSAVGLDSLAGGEAWTLASMMPATHTNLLTEAALHMDAVALI